jgi:hypothetical protein
MERLLKYKWTALHTFFHDKKGLRYYFIALGITLMVGVALIIWMRLQPMPQDPVSFGTLKAEPIKHFSPLTGALVNNDATTKRPVTAVMIENSPSARPQSGLKDAGVVYEAVAEGGITRFVALYQETSPPLIGPVRSVRPYYVEWASAFDPAMAHIGGSSRALEMIRSGSYGADIDQFFNSSSYWRASDRPAPHNVYTSGEKLAALMAAKGKTTSTFSAMPRKDDAKEKTLNASYIHLPISSPTYNVEYDYEPASNSYIRKVGGALHADREAGQITPKSVVAIQVAMTRQLEDGYREQIATTGTGRAFVFQDGKVIEGSWTRAESNTQISFVDQSGKEISLNRGQTWITALPNSKVPSWR